MAITVAMEEYELDLATVRHRGVDAFEVLGPTQVIQPHGQRFATPVRVSLPIELDRVPEDIPLELLAVLVERVEDGAPSRWEVLRAVDVDRTRGLITVAVHHFSKLTPIVDHDGFGALGLVAGMGGWREGAIEVGDCGEARTVADARSVVVDMEAFWERIGLGHHTGAGRVAKLGMYLDAEDGGEFPIGYLGFTDVRPLRTGHEVALYEMIRRHAMSEGAEKLDSMDILDMALEATLARTGKRNLPEATLTAHNVVRALARPRQWSDDYIGATGGYRCPPEDRRCGMRTRATGYGHPRSDAMTPMFEDLMGFGGADSFAGHQGVVRHKDGETIVPSSYTMSMFDPEKGIFASMPGTTDRLDNAGSHYYFWIGAVGYLGLGSTIVHGGVAKETWVKESGKTARKGQGLIQGPHVLSGLALARCIERPDTPPPNPGPVAPPSPSPQPAPAPAPIPTPSPVPPPTPDPAPKCPPQKSSSRKCPWSPDGYVVKPCPPGECYDAGPRGALACKQEKVPANAKRNSWHNVECLSGFVAVKDPCQRTIKSCVPKSD